MLIAVSLAIACFAAAVVQTVRARRYRAASLPVASPDRDLPESEAASLANLAHEMRTPLTSILGYMKTLARRSEEMTPEQRAETIAICDRLAQRQLRLIESLLSSSRLEEGAPLRRERIDLQAIVRDTLDALGGVISGHVVLCDLPAHDLRLYGNPDAIQHALSNLVENATKYSPPATAITVRVHEEGDDVVVSVADEGPGISDEELSTVFDRGVRGRNDSDRPGAGIGLSIVRGIVRAHGGRVWASSPGRGATISFTLPRRAGDTLSTAPAASDSRVLRHGSITRDALRIMRVVR